MTSPWGRELVVGLLEEAGRIALEHRTNLRRETKSDDSIVTQADRDIETLFARELESLENERFLIGEETVDEKGEEYIEAALAKTAYVIDPIDGTAPYAHGMPHWGVSVGLMQAGRLVEGAVFLPEFREGEIVLTEGGRVLEGQRRGGEWTWRTIELPPIEAVSGATLISISQDMARAGVLRASNPLQALGSAVVPLMGLLQGRFLAYVGRLKLWDLAGALPALARLGFSISHFAHGTRARARDRVASIEFALEVNDEHFVMSRDDPARWSFRGHLVVCPPEHSSWLRERIEVP